MAARDPDADFGSETEQTEGEGLDFQAVQEMTGFALNALRRHPKLSWSVFVGVAILGLTISETMPRTYEAEVKLLAQRDLVMPAIVNPGRAVPRDADNPTKNVSDMIMRRDNLVALAKEADLMDRFDSTRAPALRFKDRISGWLGGTPSEADKLRGIVGTLEKKLVVVADESTVTLTVDWGDAETARDLVTLVQKNFSEARYDSDVAILGDAITMLQGHAKTELDRLDAALADFRAAQSKSDDASSAAAPAPTPAAGPTTAGAPPASRRAPSSRPAASPGPDAELAKQLEDTRQRIRTLEADRERQIQAAQQQLSTAQLTLTPLHPTVVGLQQQVDALNKPSPELERLKSEERALMATMVPVLTPSAPGAAPAVNGGGSPASPSTTARPNPYAYAQAPEDPGIQLAKSKLEAAIKSYQEIQTRIDSANIELDLARAAFKYRFSVVTPAELPTKPKKPIAQIVAIASLFGAFLFAIGAAVLSDMAKGRILETWQIKRRLKLDVLGELDLPR